MMKTVQRMPEDESDSHVGTQIGQRVPAERAFDRDGLVRRSRSFFAVGYRTPYCEPHLSARFLAAG